MSVREKCWYLVGITFFSFIFAITSPIIQVYFISQIEPRIIAVATLIQTGLAAVVNYSIKFDSMKKLYRKHFFKIVLIDILAFSAVSIFGVEYPEIRFIGFSFLNAVSSCLWFMIMKNVANRIIVDGDERTNFEALEKTACLAASFFGGILAIIFVDIPVEYCVFAQCFANLFMGLTDLYAFKILKRGYEKEN